MKGYKLLEASKNPLALIKKKVYIQLKTATDQ